MFQFSERQRLSALIWLSLFHILIIAASNYLVQIPVEVFGFQNTWGAFSFPFIFLATDLTVRIFGAHLARRIIFFVMFPALFCSYLLSTLFFQGQWQGLAALADMNIMATRIVLASFMAYVCGQLLDILVFNRLRKMKRWWIAPSASAIFGNLFDTLVFFFIAFYQSSDAFMAANWVEIAMTDYSFKILICGVFFLPMYGVLLNYVLRLMTQHNKMSLSSI